MCYVNTLHAFEIKRKTKHDVDTRRDNIATQPTGILVVGSARVDRIYSYTEERSQKISEHVSAIGATGGQLLPTDKVNSTCTCLNHTCTLRNGYTYFLCVTFGYIISQKFNRNSRYLLHRVTSWPK